MDTPLLPAMDLEEEGLTEETEAEPEECADQSDFQPDEEEVAVMGRAVELDCVVVEAKKCHCHCQLYNGDKCMLQFTDQESDQIR